MTSNDEPEFFAWDTIRRVRRLGELSKRYPAQIQQLARQVLDWPVLSNMPTMADDYAPWRGGIELELGRDYPLDRRSRTRTHHGSEMGRYLTQWVLRLHEFRLSMRFTRHGFSSGGKPNEKMIRRFWPQANEPEPGPEVVAVLRVALQIESLTKATSDEWSKRVLVPMIMLSDAGLDERTCRVPVLQTIWKQKGVKSIATFRSRLLSTVCQLMRKRARPA